MPECATCCTWRHSGRREGSMAVAAAPAAGALLCAGPQALVCGAVGVVVGLGLLGAYVMSQNADDEAENSLSSATDDTCATCIPDPNSECGILYQKIEKLTRELARRRAEMLADRSVSQGGLGMYELYLRDPTAKVPDPRGIRRDLGNWLGHKGQIIEKQTSLINQVSLYRAKKCGPLPPSAETQAYLPPPEVPY